MNTIEKQKQRTDLSIELSHNILTYLTENEYDIPKELLNLKNCLKDYIQFSHVQRDSKKHLNKIFQSYNGALSQFEDFNFSGFSIFNLFNCFHQMSLEFEDYNETKNDNFSAFNSRKISGTYYTCYSVAYYIVKNCFEFYFKHNPKKELFQLKILEPCVGTGVFVIALVDYLFSNDFIKKTSYKQKVMLKLIEERLYCVDTDLDSIDFFKAYLSYHLKYYYNVSVNMDKLANNIFKANILRVDNIRGILKDKFDIIFFNPPYELLKPNICEFKLKEGGIALSKFSEHQKRTIDIKTFIKNSGFYKYSIKGMLNLYKIFIELATEFLAKNNSNVGFIVPLNLLGDYQCKELRINLLTKHCINHVIMIPEKNKFFQGITQAFSIVNLTTHRKTSNIKIKDEVTNENELFQKKEDLVSYKTIKELSNHQIIIPLNKITMSIVKKYYYWPRISELPDMLLNLRGEIDLTKYKDVINNKDSKGYLIRGNNVGYFNDIHLIKKKEGLDRITNKVFSIDAYDEKCKLSHSKITRIACQQISNLKTNKRLKFTLIPKNFYLGNSCNYIIIKNNLLDKFSINNYSLLCLLNSSIYNWRFKLTSTNNHISNNELGELVLPLDENKKWIYKNLQNIYMKFKNEYINVSDLGMYIDAHVFLLFGLLPNEVKYILGREKKTTFYIENVLKSIEALGSEKIYNHQVSSLSKLDSQMVESVPPGGNWKNIPDSIPSKRLDQIRDSGGRTTLYGRLKRDMPSYTISTYFNRPGNGTFIHPDYFLPHEGVTQNRLISFREAARLQSFKDFFLFFGSKSSILKQIGNAVPPLLAYHIAKSIITYSKIKHLKVIDLFCGAGGLSHGFKDAGCKILAGIDNFKDAIVTYKSNNPDTEAICDDIKKESTKFSLYNSVKGTDIDIIIGGPPCQGFSHAGWRIVDDPRNFLFKEFVEIVKKKKPLFFLMENVEGILTINEGKTFLSITELFNAMGYAVVGKTLNASEYGVPQRRKRVFIIGSTMEVKKNIFPEPCFRLIRKNKSKDKQGELFDENLPEPVTVEEAISDLPFLLDNFGELSTPAIYPLGLSTYQKLMKGLIGFDEFYSEKLRVL